MKAPAKKLETFKLLSETPINQSDSVTLGMGSRSPIFELNVTPKLDYNHVQYESPSSKTF